MVLFSLEDFYNPQSDLLLNENERCGIHLV
jgi:hypothetical protein